MYVSGLAQGISIFSSFDKAGSVPYFTQFRTHSNDYTALTRRDRSKSIIYKYIYYIKNVYNKAKLDFEKAVRINAPPRKYIAEAKLDNTSDNGTHLISTEVWDELESHCYHQNEIDKTCQYSGKTLKLGKSNGGRKEMWYPWCNKYIGDIHDENDQILGASNYFHEAIRYCGTFTVPYLGSSQSDIVKGNYYTVRGKENLPKAKDPSNSPWIVLGGLVTDIALQGGRPGSSPWIVLGGLVTGIVLEWGRAGSSPSYRGRSGVSREGDRDGNKGGGGSGSDDDDNGDDVLSKTLKKLKREAPEVKKYQGNFYYMSSCGEHWYTRDWAGHGGAEFKKYRNTRSTLEFVGSVDKNLRDMPGKHESTSILTIRKCDMDTVHRRGKKSPNKTR